MPAPELYDSTWLGEERRMRRTVSTTPSSGFSTGLIQPLVDAIDSAIQGEITQDPFQRDPRFVMRMLPPVQAINLYFNSEIRGWENLPRGRAVLIVGNHSGGAETSDTAPLLGRWVQEFGPKAPLYMLGYNLLFTYPIAGPMLRKLGVLPASQATARKALRKGGAVVVFPGGDHEVFRPWSERNKIDFGGRTGFVELALSMRVPVVPMTIHGAHQSTIVLTRGRRIARVAGLNRLHIKVFPFIWNIPLGLTPAFVPSVQLPAKVTVQFGKPLDWSHYGPEKAKDPKVVRRCYDQITGVMQRTLDSLATERPYPILTRLNELLPSQILDVLWPETTRPDGALPAPRRAPESRRSPRQRSKRPPPGAKR
jgi:1-acyl-sn-glycerol-3-phosphate acyltransferase